MYENMTFDSIMQRMLDAVPDTIDKREGSVVYDALAPAAIELQNLYIELDVVLNQTFVDTATGEYLERRCAERGITKKEASSAIVQGVFTPSGIDVDGNRFRCGDYTYVSDATGKLTCETAGTAPNGNVGELIPIDYIEGLETATISEILILGEDREDDEALREKFFEAIAEPAFGGNPADYKEKTKSIEGVSACKVTPVWNGGGTVLLTVLGADYTVPTTSLISKVQAKINGIAPIGHVVTVKGAVATTINVTFAIIYENGWSWESAGTYIEQAIDNYFAELAATWDENDNLIVRVSQIESRILNCAGVLDIQDTAINGVTNYLQLDTDKIPVRGSVSDGA
jgi:uncharacterized phage protein gp47/JayE